MNIFFRENAVYQNSELPVTVPRVLKWINGFFTLWTLFIKADAHDFHFFEIFERNKICQKLRNEKINIKFSMLTTRSYFQQAI